ncbi:MAG: 4-hydroxy-tetrahydrodipicolinate reductase [Leptospirales bacterium]|nr:4-hydroxy-tetrahydrodipicolinate reductase [Leptospirales bacterium]
MIRFAMSGAGGRMGRTIIALSRRTHSPEGKSFELVGALERPDSSLLGLDAGVTAGVGPLQIAISDQPGLALQQAQVVIDFSSAAGALAVAAACADRGVALAVGATGLSAAERARLEGFAARIPLLISPNMSLGVNILFRLTEIACKALGPGFDAEIHEVHHRFKRDAPSGTAMRLKEILLRELSREEGDVVYGRSGEPGPRGAAEIGIHALRGGDVVGDHTVYFFGDGERVELTHRASSRETFAAGALRAAAFLADQPPGLYAMKDVLGI